mgnify:CR=1 FL=1
MLILLLHNNLYSLCNYELDYYVLFMIVIVGVKDYDDLRPLASILCPMRLKSFMCLIYQCISIGMNNGSNGTVVKKAIF